MTRTFIALEMNTAVQSHLDALMHQMALDLPSIRWVDPANIHLTLAFLGELNDVQMAMAREATEVAALNIAAFSYGLTHLGTFGSPRQPRVIWMGIEEPSGTLVHLHRLLTAELAQRHLPIDSRPYSPHLTLAHLKHPLAPYEQQRFAQWLSSKSDPALSPEFYPVKHLAVMKSELQARGAHYTSLHTIALKQQ